MPLRAFETVDFDSQIQRSLGKTYLGAASTGEVNAIADQIEDGSEASWRAFADDLENRAETARAGGQDVSARQLFLRAAEAHRQATFYHRIDLDCRTANRLASGRGAFSDRLGARRYGCGTAEDAVRRPVPSWLSDNLRRYARRPSNPAAPQRL